MGLFDSVWFDCPACGKGIEVQTKVGDPCCIDFPRTEVPVIMAIDILKNDSMQECRCGAMVKIIRAEDPEETIELKAILIGMNM